MDLEAFKDYCLKKKGTWVDFPFDEKTLVMKVGSKMFALTDINSTPLWVNLKCDPFLALDLRDKYEAITPGYHMSKQHWNTVKIDGSIPQDEVNALIDHSYDLVYKRLKKSEKELIEKE
ncbi:MAG: MmcQ/YjbR family DNA-binding protein [bacterium]|nr:MmcQ/YjbR family DNA-binding protein [bacterium]